MVNVLVGEIRASSAEFIWNVGLGDGSGLLDFMQRMSEKAVRKITNFDHVIRISVPSVNEGCDSSDERKYKAITTIANELKIMDDDSTLEKLKNELEEETYCTYKVNKKKESELVERTKKLINKKLASKSCLVIVENIVKSILDPINKWLFDSGLPVPTKFGTINNSYWVISTSLVDTYYQSATETTTFLNHHICYLSKLISHGWHPAGIIELELFHVVKSISKNPPQKLTTTMDVLWRCLVYSQLCSSDHENNKNDTQDQESCSYCVQPKELVNLWILEGIFSRVPAPKVDIEQNKQEEAEQQSSWIWEGDAEPAEEILRALLSHSLLRKCTRKDASCVIVPFPGLSKLLDLWKGYVSKASDDAWVDKTWVSFLESSGPWITKPRFDSNPITTLVLRGCTRLAQFPFEIIFPLLKHLRVLDLSYSSIEQLPIHLSEMTYLQFLSLRGCTRLRSLVLDSSSNPNSSPLGTLQHLEFLDLDGVSLDIIPDDVPKSKSKLRYLNLSCASIVSLSSVFFQDVSNLKELFFLGCASLMHLPPSLTNLFSLGTFYISESQLISFPIETFDQMPKLRDLNLKNNQQLCFLPKLAGNTGLKSFSLSGSPMITHIQRFK
ncbi:Disease resistance protein (TIR-NBS-LRR class) family [Rhynchospora pubera]|uniref:Disease resistance protein (TIR-NBS-LRR class) family n=1 Tax=Rhynchospora pubera TaxID=906938 RepID=A0AAV8H010_9POAL|nr:Disease resistance protein (TIR-NBS-LRR class) family [Rhynchospora pubera]